MLQFPGLGTKEFWRNGCHITVMDNPIWRGFRACFSLILAIGAQNAFVLRQGLIRQHIGALVLFCALSDAMLIVVGVGGIASFVEMANSCRAMVICRCGVVAWSLWADTRLLCMAGHGVLYAGTVPQMG